MNQSITKLAIALFMATSTLFSLGVKADNDSDYRKYADETRKAVYAMSMPEFENPQVPKELKAESAVIMARYQDIVMGKQLGFGMNFFLTGNGIFDHNIVATYIQRELIYIGDEVAQKEYSEYEFSTHDKNWTSYGRDRQKRVLGVKVIKKSGKTVEVPTDDFIIETEGDDDKKKTHKLAVPNLEVGDYIDIMVHTSIRYQNHGITPLYFAFADTKPMLSSKIHCVIDRKLATYYRSFNGAPRFTESTNADKDIVLDASISNVDKMPTRWTRFSAQMPYIMMQVFNLRSDSFVPSHAEKGLHYVDDYKPQLAAAWDIYDDYYEYSRRFMWKKYVRKAVKNSKKLSTKERVECIYRATILTRFNLISYNQFAFFHYFIYGLDKADIEYQPFITTDLGDEPVDELGSHYNTIAGVYIPSTGDFYTYPTSNMAPNEVPSRLQGRKVFIKERRNWKAAELPTYSCDQNLAKVDMQFSIDGTQINAHRHVELSGVLKEYYQNNLLTANEIDASWRRRTGITKTREDEFMRSYVETYRESVKKENKQQNEDFKEEVKYFHNSDVQTNFKSYSIEQIGNRCDSAAFVYNVDYSIDGLVKKAGKNIIISIGKLMDDQVSINDTERKRNIDVYYTPRSFENTIRIELPTGYKVSNEALAKLNTNTSNECAEFVTKANVEGNQLVLTTRKTFKNSFEPAANWDKILKVVDAAKNFENVQVVVSKK
ncbi:MAG: DUF3857 domain-containing protein [Bacteroidales bacterium]|jgi:hypothetical protein|nr:DUF3857 domain-containing protein [Bacteroidales bacterium]